MITTRTPLRVSILGGGTDCGEACAEHGGLVVGGAINQHAHLTVKHLPPFHAYRSKIAYSQIECVGDHGSIQHGAVRACLEHCGITEGVEIHHMSDAPARSGTGSSSTFVVGLLNALYALKGEFRPPEDLAREAIYIEQTVLKENVGMQDQIWAATHSGPAFIRFHPGGSYTFSPLGLSPDHIADLENHLLLYFTNIARNSTEVAGTYYGKLKDDLGRHFAMMHLAEEGISAIRRADYEKLGKLVDSSWRMKAALSPAVCPEAVSVLYGKARIAGAVGGKLTGAGGGGSCLLIAEPKFHQDIHEVMAEAGCVRIPFKFSPVGSHVIFADRS